jgi:hypothetical protein
MGRWRAYNPRLAAHPKRFFGDQTSTSINSSTPWKDDNRYIAAHVILTMRTGYEIEKPVGGVDPLTGEILQGTTMGAAFNGLYVSLLANGTVVIPNNQRLKIASWWRDWQAKRPSSK